MNYLQLPMPETIKPVPTWNILDPSKLSSTICWRRFFYAYIVGWNSEEINKHFVFGTAWHLALEHLSLTDYSEENIELAYLKFLEYYRKFYDPITDLDNAPKNPANALLGLQEYTQTYQKSDQDYKTLHTEILVRVPINDEGRIMVGRMDKISRHSNRGIVGIDYKTGSRRSSNWEQDWKLSIQMGFYYHALNVAYPSEDIWGMIVDGVFFYKRTQKDSLTRNIPVRVPIRKSPEMHMAFLSDLNHILEMLDWNMEGLSKAKIDAPVMNCFPRVPSQCINKFQHLCPYHALCTSWANPLPYCNEPPLGFIIKHWNPGDDPEKPRPRETFNQEEGFNTPPEEPLYNTEQIKDKLRNGVTK
ncbi:MAG: PD-(D/E)XK nuclease family protein [Alphaproteobacteria bacterium]|nr:PD-(D/E)XK nuclease family protein [Alphaproteobacteria bacterium]